MLEIHTPAIHADPELLPKMRLSRTLGRVAFDFSLGVALFGVALGGLSFGHGQAVAGAAEWVTTVVPEASSGIAGTDMLTWHPISRQGALTMLALSFGAVTALNLSIARHLRAVAIPAQKTPDEPHFDPYI